MSILLSPSPLASPLASPAPRHSTSLATPRTDLLQPSPLPFRAIADHRSTEPSLPRRPSLSLSTASCPRTLGRGNTGLRLNTLNTTPTDTNTYQNTYERGDVQYCKSSAPSTPHPQSTIGVPYTRSLHLRPALKNGPIPSFHNFVVHRSKTVSFSDTPEEIDTTRSPSQSVTLASGHKHALSPSSPGDSAYTLASCHHADGDHEGSEATTPVAGRRKRAREWVWTLGEEAADDAPEMTSTSGDRASEADDAQ